jgi:hypothetical protein
LPEWESGGGGGGMVTLTMAVLMVPLAVVPKLMSTWQLVSRRKKRA